MNRYFLAISTAFLLACAAQLQAARLYTYNYGGPSVALQPNPLVTGYDDTPIDIAVSGAGGTILDVSVTLIGFEHAFVEEMTFFVRAPGGFSDMVWLFGGVNPVVDPTGPVTLTFSDHELLALPATPPLLTDGAYLPHSYYGSPSINLGVASVIANSTFHDAFFGDSPNGTWSLYAWDSATLGGGALAGWQLNITTNAAALPGGINGPNGAATGTTPEPATGMVALLAMVGFAFVRRRRA